MRFQNLLKTNGFTQIKLAERLKVTQALVSKWVTGDGTPRTKMIPEIAEVLGVSVEEVVNCFK